MKPEVLGKINILTIPIVFFRIDDKYIVAQAGGIDEELIGTDPEKLKLAFGKKLHEIGDSIQSINFPRLSDIKLYVFRIHVQPSHKEDLSYFPVNEQITLNVPLVYGLTDFGIYECYFPVFRIRYHCSNKSQIKQIGKNYAINILNRQEPEDLYPQLFQSEPWLETILAFDSHKPPDWNTQENIPDKIDVLKQIAERYPQSKSVKKQVHVFPQVAWEQKENIESVYAKIVDQKANLLLVGENGTGKSAIIHEALRRITKFVKESQPTFWGTTPRQITSKARYLGEWQKICETMIEELSLVRGVLWMNDFLSLFSVGGESAEDSVAAFMLPFISSGKVKMIAEVTPRELEAARRLFPSFTGHFQTLRIEEIDQAGSMKIISRFGEYVESNYHVDFGSKALHLSYRLLKRFVPYEKFPGKAISFLSRVVSSAIDQQQIKIVEEDVIKAFTEKTGLPKVIFHDDIILDKNELWNYFSSKIIGQPEAVVKITNIIKVYKAGINDPEKPVSVMIFAGPTGVGKTASALLLSQYFYGHGQHSDPLIRLDMSEFQHPGQISRLIGSGAGGPGKLIQKVRENPFCVILLDEIEKANPVIFDTLMTVFDEGILVDNFGRLTDFRNTIIIMTTNLGSQDRPSIGLVKSEKRDFEKPVKSFFRPEFFNRIDHIVTFQSLTQETIHDIARKELSELEQREGFIKNKISLRFNPEIETLITTVGFDKEYGARPLQRAIERELTAPIAKYLLKNNRLSNCVLSIALKDDKVVIKKEK